MRHRLRVGYADTDQGGIVHHSVYFRYLEQARVEVLRECGIDYRSLEYDDKFALPVVDAQIKYKRPALFDDILEIECWVGLLGRASVRFDYRVMRGEELLTEAKIMLACIELPSGKLRSLPPSVREPLHAVLRTASSD